VLAADSGCRVSHWAEQPVPESYGKNMNLHGCCHSYLRTSTASHASTAPTPPTITAWSGQLHSTLIEILFGGAASNKAVSILSERLSNEVLIQEFSSTAFRKLGPVYARRH